MHIQRVLLPVDFSDSSKEACAAACDLALRFDAELHRLHVREPWPPVEMVSTGSYPTERVELTLSMLDLPYSGPRPVHKVVRVGVPADEILEYINENGIDLVVIGSHGRSGLMHLLMGSVSEKVVRRAPCAVLIARESRYFTPVNVEPNKVIPASAAAS
jgi:nucleotide-binding universal stress UspA family protein